jgi:hypothetical protein
MAVNINSDSGSAEEIIYTEEVSVVHEQWCCGEIMSGQRIVISH